MALAAAIVLSGSIYAYTYLTAGGVITVTELGDFATANATATQPDWDDVLTRVADTETLRPNSAGTYTQCEAFGDSPNYACVDEEVADEDSTYIRTSGGATEIDTYNITDPSFDPSETTSNITSVKVYVRSRGTVADLHTAETVIRTHSTDYFGTSTLLPITYTVLSTNYTTNPNTGSAWTWGEVDALEAGVRQVDNGSGFAYTTQVYVEVNYEVLALAGEVPTGDLFTINPQPGYSGDLQVDVYLNNAGSLIKAYQYLNIKLHLEGSLSANETPNYRLITLQNGRTAFNMEGLILLSGSFDQTSQSDFESGNLTQLDTTTSPGDVLLDRFTDNVTDSFDDETKIASSANVTISGGQVKLIAGGTSGTETLRPNAAGDDTNIAGQYPTTGAHWDKVDEVTADEFTTYVTTNSTIYQRDLYNIPDHSTGSGAVDNVTAYFRIAKTSAIGHVGIWRDTNNTHTIGTTGVWTDVPFNSEVKTSASFDHTSDTETDLKYAGRYLIMYEVRSTSTSNSRHGIMSRVTLEGAAVEGSEGYGYSRNNSNDEAYTAGVCLIDANANDTVIIQWRPIGVSSSDVLSNSKTSLMMVRLPNSTDVAYAKYTDDTDTSNFNGTAWNNVDYADIVEETDTAVIQKSAADNYTFTLKKNARYLVKYNIGFDQGSNTRTTRSARATLAAASVENSHSNVYLRYTTVDPEWLHALFIVEVTSAPDDLIIQCTRRSGTDVDGSITRRVSASSLEIMELPPNAEVCSFYDSAGGQNVGASTILNLARNEKFRDSAAFTSPDNVHIEVEKAGDYLFLSNGYVEDPDKTSGTRLEFGVDFYLDNVLQNVGGHGNYKRGDQSTSDTWDTGWNAHAILDSLTANQQVEVRTILEGQGGGTNDNTVASECGFAALRLESLIVSDVYARAAIKTYGTVYNGSEETGDNTTFVTESYQWTTNPDTGSAWTWTEIDALQIGVELRSPSASVNATCTQVYIEVGYTAYNSPGTITSINLLSGETVAIIDDFGYNASAIPSPETSLKVQFSQDNTNWFNSTGVSDGWDSLSPGTANISLSTLDWTGSNFYYHMEFTSDGSDTPVLDEISIYFSTFYSSGNLTSSSYDTGSDQDWDWEYIYFTIYEPSATDIKFQIRTAATEGGLSSATWYGPTGTGDYYTTSSTEVNSVHDGDRWIQYKAYFSDTGADTPTLSDISITYVAGTVAYLLEVIGGGYGLVSGNTSDWGSGWTVTPELYCEVTQR